MRIVKLIDYLLLNIIDFKFVLWLIFAMVYTFKKNTKQ